MTKLLITIDTEYSSGFFDKGIARSCGENFDRTISCATGQGEVGIFHQMDLLDRYGLKAVFFVDPMPALVWGSQSIEKIVKPIIERGHDVQLHLHTEWLKFAENSPIGDKIGQNLKNFDLEDQKTLLSYAAENLVKAGAPYPKAFRAGNYGANNHTLQALASLDILFDTSLPTGSEHSACEISLPANLQLPTEIHGILEFPIGSISGRGSSRRHAQLTALSSWELNAALANASRQNDPFFVLVSHSFELINRDRMIINKIVYKRFENLCKWVAEQDQIDTGTFAEIDNQLSSVRSTIPLKHNPVRTIHRMAEQIIGNQLYG